MFLFLICPWLAEITAIGAVCQGEPEALSDSELVLDK